MPCIFPFIYRNKTYTSCTNDGNDEDVQVICVTGLGYITMIWIIGIWPYFPKTRLTHYAFLNFPRRSGVQQRQTIEENIWETTMEIAYALVL